MIEKVLIALIGYLCQIEWRNWAKNFYCVGNLIIWLIAALLDIFQLFFLLIILSARSYAFIKFDVILGKYNSA